MWVYCYNFVYVYVVVIRAGTNSEIYLHTFANKLFEHSKSFSVSFQVTGFLTFEHILLKFNLSNLNKLCKHQQY